MSATIGFDDSIFGEYIDSLVKNEVGNWELVVNQRQSKSLSGVPERHMVDFVM